MLVRLNPFLCSKLNHPHVTQNWSSRLSHVSQPPSTQFLTEMAFQDTANEHSPKLIRLALPTAEEPG